MARPRSLSLLSLLLLSACSSSPVAPDVAAAGGDSGAGGGDSGAVAESCPPGTNPSSPSRPVDVGSVSGQLVDEQGQPTSAGLVQVCGKDICINARVGDNGLLAEPVNQRLNDPACKFGDGLTWGKLALPLDKGDSALGTLTTVRLPDFADGVPFTPGKSITSNGVTLTLARSAHVDVDGLTYEDEAQQTFRAAALPNAALSELKQDFVLGFALSPVETRICPSPALSLENTTKLPVGTALELFVLGVDVLEKWAPYGGWQKVGDGQVSDDGQTLEFPDGLPLLTAIGIKVKG